MPKKLSRRTSCAVCAQPTHDAKVGEYVELEITIPESPSDARQMLGAHSFCLNRVLADGRHVEVDLIIDEEYLPSDWRETHRQWLGT